MSQPSSTILIPPQFEAVPSEMHVHILSYLRAYDLSALQQTCRYFASRSLISAVIKHTAEQVYPQQWTKSFWKEKEYTFQNLRDMEWLVVAKVLNSPEPVHGGGFYISKSWCRTALKWLEVQQSEQKLKSSLAGGSNGKKKKKMSKKEQRQRNRRLSDASPPWPNVNSDLMCQHANLQLSGSNKTARAKRRLLDKHAWKVLKRLYPDSVSMESVCGECVQCTLEHETRKRESQLQQEREKQERKKPLSDALVRGIYTRSRGVPAQSLAPDNNSKCPLLPGLYHVLPRAWLHRWRRYLKTGEGEAFVCPPDASALLCHGHRLPVLPPHLEAYLYGETSQLLASTNSRNRSGSMGEAASPPAAAAATLSHGGVVGMGPDPATLAALRAAGVSQRELDAQRFAYMTISSPQRPTPPSPSLSVSSTNELLDKENCVVVEILTDDEYTALAKWWPRVHSSFCLRFSVVDGGDIEWSTPPCRECDASGKSNDVMPQLWKVTKKQQQQQQQQQQQSQQQQQQQQSSSSSYRKKRHSRNQHSSVDLSDY